MNRFWQMTESQNAEYKESWRDEYLKWVCGFANAHGGTIYIGVDDKGHAGSGEQQEAAGGHTEQNPEQPRDCCRCQQTGERRP